MVATNLRPNEWKRLMALSGSRPRRRGARRRDRFALSSSSTVHHSKRSNRAGKSLASGGRRRSALRQAGCWTRPDLLVLGWSPPPESNRRPHPYHRCAGSSQRRAGPFVPSQQRRWEGAAEGRVMEWREVARSAVSGKSLARPCQEPMARAPTPSSRQPSTTSDRHRRWSAVLPSDDCGSSVERTAKRHPFMAMGSDRGLMAEKYGRLCPSGRVVKGCSPLE